MSRQVRVSDETYERLQKLADGRPLGMVIERALDAASTNHKFMPQERNALKCATCGNRKADH